MSALLLYHQSSSNSSLVQIEVPNAEVQNRINSFQFNKREEVNRENVVEFCHMSYKKGGQSCARVDAVLTKRSDCKSHVKVHRVVNEWGPQLGVPEPDTRVKPEADVKREPGLTLGSENEAAALPRVPMNVDERLFNAEQYLKVEANSPLPLDVYTRIRIIEERILFLEGISPEYADQMADRARLTQGKDVPHIPTNKRRFSKYEMRRRLTLLMGNLVGKKLKESHTQAVKPPSETPVHALTA